MRLVVKGEKMYGAAGMFISLVVFDFRFALFAERKQRDASRTDKSAGAAFNAIGGVQLF